MEKPIVIYTDHIMNKTLCYNFAKGSDSLLCHVNNFKEFDKTIATYGFKRGTGDLLKKVKNFYYMDHGYFNQSTRNFENKSTTLYNFNGYFRISFNDFWHDGLGNRPDDRFRKLNINLKDTKKTGEYIILSEPSEGSKNYFNLHNWVKITKDEIKKYSDREIVVHNKFSEIPLKSLLEKAFAFVSCQSTAGFQAIAEGVPAYFTHKSLKKFGNIVDIEKNQLNYDVLYAAANSQWQLKEFFSDEFKLYIDKIISK